MRQPGDEIGGYVIEEVLGSGEKGTAYLARHRRLDRRVVIKESAEKNTTETQRRGGGDRGTAFAADLRHPNVVEIIDAGECDDGRTWFAMQYVDGTDLAGLLAERGGLLAPAEAIGIARSVAAGLDYAHSRGLVHGDLTPGDVLLERTTGRVVVADFGISGRDASAEEDRRAVARLLSRMLTGRESDGRCGGLLPHTRGVFGGSVRFCGRGRRQGHRAVSRHEQEQFRPEHRRTRGPVDREVP
ncbi:protein kinase domain-containing protein [Gordonia iterans]